MPSFVRIKTMTKVTRTGREPSSPRRTALVPWSKWLHWSRGGPRRPKQNFISVPEPSDYSAEFAERLRALGIDARLIGALAALRYRRVPRSTTDVDFLARSLDGIAEAVAKDGYDVHAEVDDIGNPYALFIRGHGRRVDVLLAETDYQREALDRATSDVITVEDVIIHKLIAWRSRDIDDITDILSTAPLLDHGYIDRWVEAWDVRDRWSEILRTRNDS